MVPAMREPTTAAAALRWHTQALNDKALHLDIDIGDDWEQPKCGWYLTRLARGGPFVPARIFIEQEICPETGELLSDEVIKCEINGRLVDPEEAWPWLCREPIEESAFNYLMARAEYAKTWAPEEPAANPYKATDWLKVPTPTFTEGTPA
jgi:hypothetical protein